MPRFCGVINCANRGFKGGKRFFRVPAALKIGHDVKQVLSSRRRAKWIIALRRADLTETKLKYLWVCEDHFISGKPAHLLDSDNPDWVPSLLMGYETNISNEETESKIDDNVLPGDPNESLSFDKNLLDTENSGSAFIQSLLYKMEKEALVANKKIPRKEIDVDTVKNETNYAVKKLRIEQKSVSKEVQTDLTMEDITSLLWTSREFLLKSTSFGEKLKRV